jgi:DNA modification methylase/ParB-like chromosome segregation protein Spo0J
MEKIDPKKIIVTDRYRIKFENIEELAASIAKHGLINPIVVDENYNLIAGERRLRACMLIKLPEVLIRKIADLSEIEKREIELEENLQRKDFTWQEEVVAKQKLHELKQKLHGVAVANDGKNGWSMRDTAVALDESLGTVSMDIQLAKGMKAFPELLNEKNKAVAYKKLKSLQTSILQEELAKRLTKQGLIGRPDVINGDAFEVLKTMPSDCVDLVLTDPPYGIDIGEASTFGRQSGQKTYEDGEGETINLLDKVIPQLYRVMKNDRHLIMFCGIDKFPVISKLLSKHGFNVHHLPLIWSKGSGSYAGQQTTFTHSYEAFIHATKGKRKMNKDHIDVFNVSRVSGQGKIHPSEKPAELMRELIDLLSFPAELVLDTFAGSGVVGQAAVEMQRQVKLVELDQAFYANICARLNKTKEGAE